MEISDRDIKVTTIPELSDFVSGSAIWRVRAQGEHTRVLYESTLKPAFFVPPVIGGIIIKRHIKDETLDTFRRIERQVMTMLDSDKKQQAATENSCLLMHHDPVVSGVGSRQKRQWRQG